MQDFAQDRLLRFGRDDRRAKRVEFARWSWAWREGVRRAGDIGLWRSEAEPPIGPALRETANGECPAGGFGSKLPKQRKRMAFAERRHCRVNGFLRFGRDDKWNGRQVGNLSYREKRRSLSPSGRDGGHYVA